MLSKIKSLTVRHPKATYVVVFALGGILTLTFGFLGKIFGAPAGALQSVVNKVTPGAGA
jgi:hypothetical protein